MLIRALNVQSFEARNLHTLKLGGHVLTPFFGTCQSDKQAADEEMGGQQNKGKKRCVLGLWAKMGVIANGAERRSQRDHVGKLSLRFLYYLFKKDCFLDSQV